MAKPFKPQIICANELLSGKAVWMKQDGSWSYDIHFAALAETREEADQMLDVVKTQMHYIAGAWLAEGAKNADGQTVPAHFREKFRVSGPTYHQEGTHVSL